MARKPRKPPKVKVVNVDLKGKAHNGEGRPELQFPDPVTGEMIGGQVAAARQMMRYPHCVLPWARRQGKSKTRPFVIQNEATITPGDYYAGICYPDHTTAYKVADDFRRSWGDMVHSYKVNDKDQDRWIELHPMRPPDGPPPDYFTAPMKARWEQCLTTSDRNTRVKVFFWSAKHPHYEGIQGFPHHFNRIDWDEFQQIHPLARGIVCPMLRDVRGSECYSGTPWHTGIGNVEFSKLWRLAGDPSMEGWFRMRIPDGSNPHVPPVSETDRRTMTVQQIKQTLEAQFLTGEGAVFENIEAVMVLKPILPGDASLDWVRDIRRAAGIPSMKWWVHEPKPTLGNIYAASIDWARSPNGDYSVLSVWDMTTCKQVALFRWRGEPMTHQLEAVLAITNWYAAHQLHSDANGLGHAMSDFMRRRHARGFVGHRFGRNKEDYVTRGRILFQDGEIQMINCPEQHEEFMAFSAFEAEGLGSDKVIKYCAPAGEHDDLVASFLHLAPTLTIVGRQDAAPAEELHEDILSSDGKTTIEKLFEDEDMPWEHHGPVKPDSAPDWDDVVLGPRFDR